MKIHPRTILLFCLLTLFSLTYPLGQTEAAFIDPVAKHTRLIRELIEQEHWQQVTEPVTQLKSIFKKNKWKYQLLGDEEEFEQLNREIDKLQVAVKEKEKTEASIIIATILSIIKDIYSL